MLENSFNNAQYNYCVSTRQKQQLCMYGKLTGEEVKTQMLQDCYDDGQKQKETCIFFHPLVRGHA